MLNFDDNSHCIIADCSRSQYLVSVTYPTSNTDNRDTHDKVPLAYAGEMNYTVIVDSGYYFACDIKIIANDIFEVDVQTILFSKS